MTDYSNLLDQIEGRLREMKERADAATPDPHLTRYDHGGGRSWTGPEGPREALGEDRRRLVADYYQEADREFYHHARTDLPALVGWALELVTEKRDYLLSFHIESLARALGLQVTPEKDGR